MCIICYRALDTCILKCHDPMVPRIRKSGNRSSTNSNTTKRSDQNPTWEQYLEHVQLTFSILRQHQFYVKMRKCAFNKQEKEYLGHIITHRGIKVDEKKIDAMVAWPRPSNITELCEFLGLTDYYHKFVQGYGLIAQPLTNLLKKGKFLWNEEAESAFLALKQAMTSTPTLAMPNFTESFSIETDASGNGIGIVLTQRNSPIAYMSRALGITKQTLSIYVKEMLAIVEAIRLWRPYLLGHKFYIITDQRILNFFLNRFNSGAAKMGGQIIGPETKAPVGLLQPLPIPAQVWEDITLDFIEGLPNSYGKDTILVVVDRLSKFSHFIPLTHPFMAKVVTEKFIEGVVKLHGMPRSIISDRNPIFISNFWQEFFKLSDSKLMLSSAYHPQTDGQTEVVNRCVEQYLCCFVHQWSRKWSNYLAWVEYWFNTTYHTSTKMTPYQALYGRLSLLLPAYPEGLSPVHEVDQTFMHRDELLHKLKTNLEISMNRMKQQADSKRRDTQFEVGDRVLLKLHQYRQQTVFKRAHKKLSSRYYGPYPILEKIRVVAYRLHLPPTARIHPVFHVSLLKPYNGTPVVIPLDLPPLADDVIITLEPQQILDT
ncbi:hypothetical protein F3Y22_tig00110597pilonHSYRG01056 [Hibiscus syriacus]|uniref:Integrase catalytic domain-containing protein n=1 Tax=Hibiscus syriacus TaxID=106335 RepID=A0A6A3A4D1_HIBSY|nr:hypothetical protein F3Y22_tig00110597pilonHSYRG01056 [Hibiscus syriacus]